MTHRTTIRTAAACLAVTMTLLLAGCGGAAGPEESGEPTSSDPASPSLSATVEETPAAEESPEAAEPVTITIEGFEYSDPGPVAPGTEITVENLDDAAHTVTAADPGDFDLTVAPGETATFTAPAEPGEYPYVCSFHANMSATLVVS